MAGALVKSIGQSLGKQSIGDALRAGGWKVLIDGNLAEELIEHGPGGELIGVDHHGNKYFEKKDAQVGRNRWVIYANSQDWRSQDPSTVPPEWHGWLHAITDENPTNAEFKAPIYALPASAHPTLTKDPYQPKGAWSNPAPRSWKKYQAWDPSTARRSQ